MLELRKRYIYIFINMRTSHEQILNIKHFIYHAFQIGNGFIHLPAEIKEEKFGLIATSSIGCDSIGKKC